MKTFITHSLHLPRMPMSDLPRRAAPMFALACALALACAPGQAAHAFEGDGDGDGARAPAAAGEAYRCDLRRSANVCREFSVVADHTQRLRMLADGCASMGGTFTAGASCPRERRVARCMDVVPDPNHLDRLGHTYEVHYYADVEGTGTQGGWNAGAVRRVCDNLMGDYAPE